MSLRRPAATLVFVGALVAAGWLGHRDESPAASDAAAGLQLTERAVERGLVFRHVPFVPDARLEHIEPQVSATGAGVSVVDVNGDGWLDVFATSSGGGSPCGLFLNQGDGSFRDVAAQAGLADLAQEGRCAPMGSVWADWDGDGDPDVFIYAYGQSLLLRQDPGLTFTDVTEAAGLLGWMNANAASWLDYDGDGLLDLYVGGYFADSTDLWRLEHTRVMQDSMEFSSNGGHNRLWRNLGQGRFADVTAATGSDSTRWTYAVVSADFDDDGRPDLYLANDFGPEELFLNRGGTHFELLKDAGLEEDSKSGMCVALGSASNDGRQSLFVTNISERGFLFQGNNLRTNLLPEGGPLLETARGHAADCGWAWGAQFSDLDNDGWQDLFVANGFVSADPEKSYWYDMGKIGGALGSVVADASHWPPMTGRSLSGYETSRVLHNQQGRGFVNVAESVGVDDRFDGRAVAVGDLFQDGFPDVLVANQKGPLLLYDNPPIEGRNWIRLKLQASSGPAEAWGAAVVVKFDGHVQRHDVVSSVGFCAQNDRALQVGLGAATQLDRVTVRWPSGTLQELSDLPAGREHLIVEPAP